ncbi:MAG: hypothetical protein B1H13_07990 [Desulfobacteraceae bacterium 4484_190.3]|nr:MAG: hypothetical protein B1H13_07990 [Desulfobacteraceae bacterium 4484_190.3]
MKILILGGSGMLGSECKEVLGRRHEIITPDRESLNIVSWDQVIDRLQQISPEIVLNCAGFTDVDASEEEDFAVRKINVEGPRNLAQGAARFGSKLGWLYSRGGSNFIKAILSAALKLRNSALKVVDDQFGSPTWTYRVAHQIEALLNRGGRGTYHATSEGFCSKFEWAAFVVEKLGLKVPVEPCKTEDFPTPARRPVNSILENRLLKKQGINVMRDWKEDLNEFLDLYGEDLIKEASRD